MSQMELDFTAPATVLYPEHRVRKTGGHSRSEARPQHVYIRLTERDRRRYNQIVGGFKHFLGPNATGADVFEKYGIPAMAAALKELADKRGLTAEEAEAMASEDPAAVAARGQN